MGNCWCNFFWFRNFRLRAPFWHSSQHQKPPKNDIALVFRAFKCYFRILLPKILPWTNFQRHRVSSSHGLAKNLMNGTSRRMQNAGQFQSTGPSFENLFGIVQKNILDLFLTLLYPTLKGEKRKEIWGVGYWRGRNGMQLPFKSFHRVWNLQIHTRQARQKGHDRK